MATNKNLPPCTCKANTWNQGGARLSPDINQIGFTCGSCGLVGTSLDDFKNNIFLIFEKSDEAGKTVFGWVNTILLPTWRDYQTRLQGTTDASSIKKITLPPQLPKEATAYVKDGEVWKEVNHEESAKQEVPADPIRTQHDAYYKEIFDTLEFVLGCPITWEHIPNEYGGYENQPWFQFTLGANTIKVGPRKRVTAIKLSCNEGFNASKISETAINANVSYWAGKEGADDRSWKSTEPRVKDLEVHAWSKEQLIQFLTIICEESLQPA